MLVKYQAGYIWTVLYIEKKAQLGKSCQEFHLSSFRPDVAVLDAEGTNRPRWWPGLGTCNKINVFSKSSSFIIVVLLIGGNNIISAWS